MEQLVFVTLTVALGERESMANLALALELTDSIASIISTYISSCKTSHIAIPIYTNGRNAISLLVHVDQKYSIKSSND